MISWSPLKELYNARRIRQAAGLLCVLVTLVTVGCSGSDSVDDGAAPPVSTTQETDRSVDEPVAVPTTAPVAVPTPAPTVTPQTIQAQDEDSQGAATSNAEEDPTFIIPVPAVPKNQPVIRQAQADGDGPDNPTTRTVTAERPVDLAGQVSTFLDRIDVISVEGATPGAPFVVAARCIGFESSSDQALNLRVATDSGPQGEGGCSRTDETILVPIDAPQSGPIVVTIDVNPDGGDESNNTFVEYQLFVGPAAAEGSPGPFDAVPNDQRASDDGDSRENPQAEGASGELTGELSGPLGDSSDWSSFEFGADEVAVVWSSFSCTDFVSADDSAKATATIFRGVDRGVSFECTPDVPESSRALRFQPDVTYFINVEFSGSGYVVWAFETSEP